MPARHCERSRSEWEATKAATSGWHWASYGFVIIPFVTIVLSAWLDNEPVGVGLVLGGLLVLAGVMSEHSVPPESLQLLRMRKTDMG